MNIRLGIYFLLIIVGLVVLAWPEQDDQMMIQFSETHGPSSLDLAGIVILLGGYVPLILPAITKIRDDTTSSRQDFFKVINHSRRYLFVIDRRCADDW